MDIFNYQPQQCGPYGEVCVCVCPGDTHSTGDCYKTARDSLWTNMVTVIASQPRIMQSGNFQGGVVKFNMISKIGVVRPMSTKYSRL